MEHKEYQTVHKSIPKKDAMQLLLGKPVYVDDITGDALTVKLLRSTKANAIVEDVQISVAQKVPGIVAIYTWKDVPKHRFAIAGQTYPEPSPYDRLIIDRHVRFVGDVVAIIAAEDEKAALKAMLDDESELVTIYYGCDVKEEDAEKLKEEAESLFPDKELELQYGGQPIYYYMISAE